MLHGVVPGMYRESVLLKVYEEKEPCELRERGKKGRRGLGERGRKFKLRDGSPDARSF